MNPSGCAEGWATDEFLAFNPVTTPPTCEVNLAGFYFFFSLVCALKTVNTLAQFVVWRRKVMRHGALLRNGAKRLPIIPSISVVSMCALFIMFGMCATNTANEYNGVSGVLLSLYFFPVTVQMYAVLDRVIRLGTRIIPTAARIAANNTSDPAATLSSSSSGGGVEPNGLVIDANAAKTDAVLKLGKAICVICVFTACGLMIVMVFVDQKQTVLQAALVLAGVLDVVLTMCLTYQMERVLHVLYKHQVSMGELGKTQNKVQGAVKNLRQHQIVALLSGSLAGVLWFLLASFSIVRPYWYLILVTCLFELTAGLPLLLVFTGRKPQTFLSARPADDMASGGGGSVIARAESAPDE
jgi:hypothetical protein